MAENGKVEVWSFEGEYLGKGIKTGEEVPVHEVLTLKQFEEQFKKYTKMNPQLRSVRATPEQIQEAKEDSETLKKLEEVYKTRNTPVILLDNGRTVYGVQVRFKSLQSF